MSLLCGVEIGGTKCVCVLGNARGEIRAQTSVPTGRDPRATLEQIAATLEEWSHAHGAPRVIGVASFGPLELRRDSARYGCLAVTPKEGWSHVPIAGFFARRFKVAVALATDVIGAALAEARWGAARGLSNFAYVTVGTGIGAGVIVGGRPLIGRQHPELGHLRAPRFPGDTWPGVCRFHGDCIEGLACGPAIEARSGAPAASLTVDSPVWVPVAHALGQLAHTLVVGFGPERILIGGGVAAAQPHLFDRIRAQLRASLNGYLDIEQVPGGFESFLTPPGLGTLAGPLGALAVAADAYPDGSNP